MRSIESHWYRDSLLSRLLLPVSWVYRAAMFVRRSLYRAGIRRGVHAGVPVIVVGNITVGGTGKTPLVIHLARLFANAGYRPGIVTRGYRGAAKSWPLLARADSDPAQLGDEPVMLARRADCPVVADPERARAAIELVNTHGCDLIISDDGLQHLRLARDIEIVVIDGDRRFGNDRCLPAGPLREPATRARAADARVVQGSPRSGEWGMRLAERGFFRLGKSDSPAAATAFGAEPVHAVAGIGNPERFFAHLRRLGLSVIAHPFPDHHRFQPGDIGFADGRPVIMTEKDAVKCERFATASIAWYLAVEAVPDQSFDKWILQRLRDVAHG